jgi:hypothetical protein
MTSRSLSPRPRRGGLCLLLAALVLGSCVDGNEPVATPVPLTRVRADRTYLRDEQGRYIFIHGVNVSGSTKVPATLDGKAPDKLNSNGLPSYVGKPFAVDQAREHFARLRTFGFNAVRLLLVWEGIEPVKRGQYDRVYLASIRELVKIAGENGIYVLLDMHQDMFSRHLRVRYNEEPRYGAPGSIENNLLALVYPYSDVVNGDGAPRWAVEACLQEKNTASASWGIPRVLGGLEPGDLAAFARLYQRLTQGTSTTTPPTPEWVGYFLLNLPDKFAVNESTDLLPFTQWGVAHALSLDLARCYACLLAGDKVFPTLQKDGQNIKDYLQQAYTDAWAQVAEQVKDLPNVLGYDIINEPGGNFLTLSAVAGVLRAGVVDGAKSILVSLLGAENGADVYDILVGLSILPPDTKPETLKLWGLDKLDLLAVLNLNNGFDENHMRPLFERVGTAIQNIDSKAVIYIEGTTSAGSLLGGVGGGLAGQWEVPMTRPTLPKSDQLVFAPHWYPDIYPFPGFNQVPRQFTTEQVRHRDYQPNLESARATGAYSLGNPPVVFGEFGTYFNFNGIDQSKASNYEVSSHILDNYFEAFERMFQSHMIWCYSPDNDDRYGDHWNKENFSVLDAAGQPRSQAAWSRPFARALAGKPIATHFYSDLHYYDPDKGQQLPRREFEVRYASKETAAPTEIFVPQVQYPDGFYVWISDGYCYYDHRTFTLYHYPSDDAPGAAHWVRLLPPLPNQVNQGWRYFFKGDLTLRGN